MAVLARYLVANQHHTFVSLEGAEQGRKPIVAYRPFMLFLSWRIASRKSCANLKKSSRRQTRQLITLAIETSCDDTAVAILEKQGNSATLHFNEKVTANNGVYKGIHPLVALESHQLNLSALIRKAVQHIPSTDAQANKRKPDFVSVTRGPGMRSNLSTGLDTAKGLAVAWDIPLLGVHHMQSHALTPRLDYALRKTDLNSPLKPSFPFLSLLVSGGHTLLIHSESLTKHKILANTLDIAIGDCIDKSARSILPAAILADSPSGAFGPALEHFAFPNGLTDYNYAPPSSRSEELASCTLPSPYGWPFALPLATSEGGRKSRMLAFAFSGMNTYVQRLVERGWDRDGNKLSKLARHIPMSVDEARYLAREVQRVAFEHLASRVVLVLQDMQKKQLEVPKTIVISGGVAANAFLRLVMESFLVVRGFESVKVVTPPVSLCTDNAAMIAWAGMEMFEAGFVNDLNIRALRKWSLENVEYPEREEDAKDIVTALRDKNRRQAEEMEFVRIECSRRRAE